MKKYIKSIFECPVKSVSVIFIILLTIIVGISLGWGHVNRLIFPNTIIGLYNKDMWKDLLISLHGSLLDLSVVGILIFWLDSRRNKMSEIRRLEEEISDYATLDNPEINIKKQGNIKRLHGLGVFTINVQNLTLNDLNIKNIALKNSNLIGLKLKNGFLSDSKFIENEMRSSNFEKTKLKATAFNSCSMYKSIFIGSVCRGTVFEKTNLSEVNFEGCDLQSANFHESKIYNSTFKDANLRQCSFKNVEGIDVSEIAKARCVDYIHMSPELLKKLYALRPDMKHQAKILDGFRTEGIEPSDTH
ncbi:pentapeptide repeat-containing protein [Aeromonas media]|uniref:pentapeptide repeat-containing protein n=1 Tax=Aeromonas media TaxID=651 RepID=UPI001F386216|nr:pentapeptide repeat-containing protein [Aeromonas media]MCE9926278.1 pentapeptide repeat-containing protein [Aeromonas media]